MKLRKWEAFEASLTIVGDEAALPGERIPKKRRKKKPDMKPNNVYRRERLLNDPDHAERRRAYEREYNKRPERRAYFREWKRAHRNHPGRHPVASLHSLKCTGETKKKGCVCHKITVYSGPAK